MHTIEPYYKWRDLYTAEEDRNSPFFGRQYSEFSFTKKIYNYFIHPQWDDFGSTTLYMKIIFADYENQYVIIELIGEWNDAINNDVMFLKREIIDHLLQLDIKYFILIGENVLNFHASDDCYYQEWYEELSEMSGWVTLVNMYDHVIDEMQQEGIQYYTHVGGLFNEIEWRGKKPQHLFEEIKNRMNSGVKQLRY